MMKVDPGQGIEEEVGLMMLLRESCLSERWQRGYRNCIELYIPTFKVIVIPHWRAFCLLVDLEPLWSLSEENHELTIL